MEIPLLEERALAFALFINSLLEAPVLLPGRFYPFVGSTCNPGWRADYGTVVVHWVPKFICY